ncbi:MAG: DUF488 domain-containing protein [Verrucomicrobia bacterium]|nr:DUF488 domain-containing protein [Verrucomicrobiota bacterium]MBU4246761.1 DUF488 domain-containing protein [Verrucomicrobiota bacterium]MBU4291182.1 DUF488 domain-containing protein [Verrucomicrobiota bacterium]MBU4496940.1 DUF488 domain-containing protein [Verrucomicrobiota bacterium]MCG2681921.1 DUF488 domain-containing protein [Kiritimatiellia bacterium]
MPKLYTIGFTQKSAREFIRLLQDNGVTLVGDVRLNNSGQLAGYTKARDLEFFLGLVGIGYQYWKSFAPTKAIRNAYHADHDFGRYETAYRDLLAQRNALSTIDDGIFISKSVCLLCSESTAEKCHRRVAAEWIAASIPALEVVHL